MFDDKDAKFLKNNTLKIIHSHNKPARERQGKFCFKDYIATPFVLLPITIAPRCASALWDIDLSELILDITHVCI